MRSDSILIPCLWSKIGAELPLRRLFCPVPQTQIRSFPFPGVTIAAEAASPTNGRFENVLASVGVCSRESRSIEAEVRDPSLSASIWS